MNTLIDIKQQTGLKLQKPSMYKVLLVNDDFTPVEFVKSLLEQLFHKTGDDASAIAIDVHQKGIGLAGIYTFEVAETKASYVDHYAKTHEHPLKCLIEKE
jgi:ATP-dependent Clp protease adaptor protein ClpS